MPGPGLILCRALPYSGSPRLYPLYFLQKKRFLWLRLNALPEPKQVLFPFGYSRFRSSCNQSPTHGNGEEKTVKLAERQQRLKTHKKVTPMGIGVTFFPYSVSRIHIISPETETGGAFELQLPGPQHPSVSPIWVSAVLIQYSRGTQIYRSFAHRPNSTAGVWLGQTAKHPG